MKMAIQHAMGDPKWVPGILAPQAVRDFARAAETGGYGAIAFTDHPAPSDRWIAAGGEGVVDLVAALSFCAAVTDELRLMSLVLVPAFRNPFLTAHQLATVDALSAGRLTVGIGTGYLFSEFHSLGSDPKRRRAAFDEAVDVMRQAWTGQPVSVQGTGYSANGTVVMPPVVQRPHPPLWIHGNSPFGIERAARYGQGWLGMLTGSSDVVPRTVRTRPLPDVDTLARRIDEVRAATERAGRNPQDLEIAVAGSWPMLDTRVGWDVDRYLADSAELARLGVGWMVMLCGAGDDPAAALETVQRFGEEIVQPALG